jgi:integrase
VWTRENGWPIDKADDAAEFRRLQDAAKVRHPDGRHYYGHEMRNTTATLLLEADIDPVTITAIMGHSSWVVSAGYMKAREPRLRAAMEQIAEALRPRELT